MGAKKKTVIETRNYVWDEEKGDWKPTDKSVRTEEYDDTTPVLDHPWAMKPAPRPYFDITHGYYDPRSGKVLQY